MSITVSLQRFFLTKIILNILGNNHFKLNITKKIRNNLSLKHYADKIKYNQILIKYYLPAFKRFAR